MRTVPRPGTARPSATLASAAPRMAATTAGAPHSSVTPSRSTRERISSPSTLRRTTCGPAHARHGVGHPPPVAVEHRQRVEEHVAVVHAGVPPEHRGVEPAVAVRQLHPLGPRRRPRGVVDRARGVLVGLPRSWLLARLGRREERGVLLPVEREPVRHLDGRPPRPPARGRTGGPTPPSARRCTRSPPR